MTPSQRDKPVENLAEAIEHKFGHRVSILLNEHEAAGRFKDQAQCQLFSMLPRELRDHIWAYCTAPFEDPAHPYTETSYWYRPGHTARLKTDTSLLRTCRRIWLEANEMPMLQAEHSFYYHRGAPDARDPGWMASLTEHNRQNLGHLHLFVQMFAIENLTAYRGVLRAFFLKTRARPGDFQPRLFHVTVRHTDWWFWEDEAPLKLQYLWVQSMLDSPDLRSTQTFKLELETLDYKVVQLKPILETLRKLESKIFETHLINGKPEKTQFVLSDYEEELKWDGPTDINSNNYRPYSGLDRLKYYSVTLTWRLHFPDIPRAFVPTLRRKLRYDATVAAAAVAAAEDGEDDDLEEPSWGWLVQNGLTPFGYTPPHHLPYADESAHSCVIQLRVKQQRWRERIARASGKPPPPPMDQNLLVAWLRHKAIRHISKEQADDVEQNRWRAFGRAISGHMQMRWDKQGSLLKFVGPRDS